MHYCSNKEGVSSDKEFMLEPVSMERSCVKPSSLVQSCFTSGQVVTVVERTWLELSFLP